MPDCLKQSVPGNLHLYDPGFKSGVCRTRGAHCGTASSLHRQNYAASRKRMEKRSRRAVKLLMRYQRYTSITHACPLSLAKSTGASVSRVERINARCHTRFGVSRRERFEALEKSALKSLPQGEFEGAEWKEATLHRTLSPQRIQAITTQRPTISAKGCGSNSLSARSRSFLNPGQRQRASAQPL